MSLDQPLTDREREILSLIAKGLVAEEIAWKLGITPSQTRAHVRDILAKLGRGPDDEPTQPGG